MVKSLQKCVTQLTQLFFDILGRLTCNLAGLDFGAEHAKVGQIVTFFAYRPPIRQSSEFRVY